jgi:poly-D-alanine transfer protein DltD
MVALLKTLILLIIASALAIAALLVPAQIRSVDPTVVELAGANSSSVEDKIWDDSQQPQAVKTPPNRPIFNSS